MNTKPWSDVSDIELREQELKEEIKCLKAKLQKKDRELRHYWKLAESWMHDYDKLKAKYEPKEVVHGE